MRDPLSAAAALLDNLPSLVHLAANGTIEAWEAAFTANPDALNKLLADYIKQIYATPGRVGQRPMPREEHVDLDTLLHGEITDRPITEVLPKLLRTSERAFATRVHMSRSQFQRLLAGTYTPTVSELASIAEAAGVRPAYVRDFRHAIVTAAFVQRIEEPPGIATHLYRTYLKVVAPRKRRK